MTWTALIILYVIGVILSATLFTLDFSKTYKKIIVADIIFITLVSIFSWATVFAIILEKIGSFIFRNIDLDKVIWRKDEE